MVEIGSAGAVVMLPTRIGGLTKHRRRQMLRRARRAHRDGAKLLAAIYYAGVGCLYVRPATQALLGYDKLAVEVISDYAALVSAVRSSAVEE